MNVFIGEGDLKLSYNFLNCILCSTALSINYKKSENLVFIMSSNRVVEEIDPLREEREGKVREVGPQAVWSLSSCKPGIYLFQTAFLKITL